MNCLWRGSNRPTRDTDGLRRPIGEPQTAVVPVDDVKGLVSGPGHPRVFGVRVRYRVDEAIAPLPGSAIHISRFGPEVIPMGRLPLGSGTSVVAPVVGSSAATADPSGSVNQIRRSGPTGKVADATAWIRHRVGLDDSCARIDAKEAVGMAVVDVERTAGIGEPQCVVRPNDNIVGVVWHDCGIQRDWRAGHRHHTELSPGLVAEPDPRVGADCERARRGPWLIADGELVDRHLNRIDPAQSAGCHRRTRCCRYRHGCEIGGGG